MKKGGHSQVVNELEPLCIEPDSYEYLLRTVPYFKLYKRLRASPSRWFASRMPRRSEASVTSRAHSSSAMFGEVVVLSVVFALASRAALALW